MMKNIFYTILIASAFTIDAGAQTTNMIFGPYNGISVYSGTSNKDMAWCGGVNNPQFSLADINKDNKKDLVIFEEFVGVQTFINQGSAGNPQYVYNPSYEANFPQGLMGYMQLVDYNRDNIPDLVHRGQAGFSVYKGYWGTDNKIAFTFYKELYYNTGTGWINAYVEPVDIPSILDIDGDGDLDFLAYYINGGNINWYRNCQVEDGLPKDSIRICLKDVCWGRAFQNFTRTQQLNWSCTQYGVTCKGTKATHAGNALCILDYDGDADWDLFCGNVSFPDIQYLRNGRRDYNYPIDTMIAQDTLWSSNGHALNMPTFPGAFWLDVDQDGDNDLLFSPHLQHSENYKSIAYYKNIGNNSAPNFVFQSDTFLVQNMIDMGEASYPVLYDFNKDGKLDLFVGSDGFYQSNGTLKSRVSYYMNTSSGSTKSFTLQNSDFLNIDALNIKGTALSMGDLDNDGKDELIVGMTDGTILLYNNTAASSSVQPVWVQAGTKLQTNTGADIDAGFYAAPFIYDIDSDGKADLLIGNQAGDLIYYKNVGTGSGIKLQFKTNNLGGVKLQEQGNVYTYSTPFIGKIDNTGNKYLLLGSLSGLIYRYQGFQNGNVTTPYTMIDSGYSQLYGGTRSVPTVGDIDADGKYEMFLGNTLGGVKLYKQYFDVSVDNLIRGNNAVKIFPNPASDQVAITWNDAFSLSGGEITISMVSVTGQVLKTQKVNSNNKRAVLDLPNLPSGVYYCIVRSGIDQAIKPLSIIK